MATWIPSKTSYWVTPPLKVPGGEDFKRIEGNTEYLKEQTDGIKSGSIKVGKADSAGKIKKGEVTLYYLGSEIITHNFGSINIIVTVGIKRSYGVVSGGAYRIIDSNRVRIVATHDGTQTYVYTIFKP